jgi:hypothetical protein
MSKNFLIITSIFPPTEAVKKFAEIPGWSVVVVGDKKSPKDWSHPSVTFLSPDDQENLNFKVSKLLPWNHYSRKIIGYLYAIKRGATVIADSDDDNIPYDTWPALPASWKADMTISNTDYVNTYRFFTDKLLWPRGYPLDRILQNNSYTEKNDSEKVGIWQFLADEDPDVDAIYRLTNNEPVYFENGPTLALDSGTVCPFNSQNTIFKKELFPLLYLPAFVTFRFTDILRGLIAQPILWERGYRLAFGPATVLQKRNPHNYLRDFESEVPVYLEGQHATEISIETIKKNRGRSTTELLLAIYTELEAKKITTRDETDLLRTWIHDLNELGIS